MERTEAEKYVTEKLGEMLGEGSRYRTGALLLTYPSPDGDGCRQAQIIGLGRHQPDDIAPDVVALVDGMRGLSSKFGKQVALWEPLDTFNRNAVTALGKLVVIMSPPPQTISIDHALSLAAWLIAAANLAGAERALETVEATVEAIESV